MIVDDAHCATPSMACALLMGCGCARQVKQAFRSAAGLAPAEGEAALSMHLTDAEVRTARVQPTVTLVTRKPITASAEEAEANPRSRSAKLRVVEKL